MKLAEALNASAQKRAVNRSGSQTPLVEVYQIDMFDPTQGWSVLATGFSGVMYTGHQLDWIEDFLKRPINTVKTDDLDPDAWEAS